MGESIVVGLIDQYEARIDPHMRDAKTNETWSEYKHRKFQRAYKLRGKLKP